MKAPKPEPEKVNPLKRPLDPKDAKELAKKLILSGKVFIPTKPTVEKTVFKRSRILERKLSSTGRTEGHGGLTPGYASSYHAEPHFEPFTPHGGDGPSSDSSKKFAMPAPKYSMGTPNSEPPPPKPLPKQFFAPPAPQPQKVIKEVVVSYPDPPAPPPPPPPPPRDHAIPKVQPRPKRGPTIYVGAQDLTEDTLKSVFAEFGKIGKVNIHSANVGFVTFETAEIAERAIAEVITLNIQLSLIKTIKIAINIFFLYFK